MILWNLINREIIYKTFCLLIYAFQPMNWKNKKFYQQNRELNEKLFVFVVVSITRSQISNSVRIELTVLAPYCYLHMIRLNLIFVSDSFV